MPLTSVLAFFEGRIQENLPSEPSFVDSEGFLTKMACITKLHVRITKESEAGIVPAADPNVTSNAERRALWDMTLATANSQPGFNAYLINRERLEAYGVPNIDQIYPDPQGPNAIPAGPNPQMMELQIKAQKEQVRALEVQNNYQLGVAKLVQQANLIEAQVMELRAQAMREVKQAEGVEIGHTIALLDLQIAEKNEARKAILDTIDMMHTLIGGKSGDGQAARNPERLERAIPALEAVAGNAAVLQLPSTSSGIG